jgi:glutathione S-transferase
MSIIYYYSPMSSAVRTTWAVEELGLDCERRLVDLRQKATRDPEFLRKNPNGKIPVLEVDGVPIFESTAILLYLAETYGVDAGLYPRPGLARAQAMQWMIWGQVTLAEAVMRFGRNISPLIPAEQHNAAAAAAARQDVDTALGILDASLADRDYLVGDSFSFADLAVAGFFGWIEFMQLEYAHWPRVRAWAQRCRSRPAQLRSAA